MSRPFCDCCDFNSTADGDIKIPQNINALWKFTFLHFLHFYILLVSFFLPSLHSHKTCWNIISACLTADWLNLVWP